MLNIAPAAGAAANSSDALYSTQQGATTSINGMTGTTATLSASQQAQYVLVEAGVNSTAQTAIYGGNLGKNFVGSLKTAAIYQAGADAAGEVGQQYHNAELEAKLTGTTVSLGEDALHLAGHALVGCAVGAAASGRCGAGAIGGVVGEGVAQYTGDTKTGQLAAVGAALITGQDAKGIYTANGQAVNAIENNWLLYAGYTGGASGGGLTGAAGTGFVIDGHGNYGNYAVAGGGLSAGAGGSVGWTFGIYPGADKIQDFSDRFNNISIGAGAGAYGSLDVFQNPTHPNWTDINGYGAGITVGAGLGGSASVTETWTKVNQQGNVFNNINK